MPLKLSYFGMGDPEYYGIRCERLPGVPPPAQVTTEVNPGEVVAVSATNLQSLRMEQGRRIQPDMRMEERRSVTRQRDFNRREMYRTDDRRRDYGRYRDRNVSSFVFLGGPRLVVRGYGPGWCRGLHRGYHWAPRIGWHRGTHRGLFRC